MHDIHALERCLARVEVNEDNVNEGDAAYANNKDVSDYTDCISSANYSHYIDGLTDRLLESCPMWASTSVYDTMNGMFRMSPVKS